MGETEDTPVRPGSGVVECSRCSGTGVYQSFLEGCDACESTGYVLSIEDHPSPRRVMADALKAGLTRLNGPGPDDAWGLAGSVLDALRAAGWVFQAPPPPDGSQR